MEHLRRNISFFIKVKKKKKKKLRIGSMNQRVTDTVGGASSQFTGLCKRPDEAKKKPCTVTKNAKQLRHQFAYS